MALHRTAAALRAAIPATSSASSPRLPPLPAVKNHLLATQPATHNGLASSLVRRHQSSSPTRGALSNFINKSRTPSVKLRTHAVSIIDGDYGDPMGDDDLDGGEEMAFPPEYLDMDDDGWDLTPADARARAEAEEAAYDDDDGDDDDDDEYGGNNSDYDSKLATEALEQQRTYDALRKKWAANSRPKTRTRQIDDRGRAYGRGSRKEASARVWIYPGQGTVSINRQDMVDYFPRESHRESILGPFVATRTAGLFDVRAHVEGGGLTGKAEAVRHGLARALERYDPTHRAPMKRLGYLRRDPRMVERKKVGRVKARKSPQWVRR